MSLNDDSGGFQIQVRNQYLMVCTKAGLVKVWDVSKRDMRAHCHPISLKEKLGDFTDDFDLEDVQMNCNATFIRYHLRFEFQLTHSNLSTILPLIKNDQIMHEAIKNYKFQVFNFIFLSHKPA